MSRRRAFTLIELMITVGITAMIFAMISAILFSTIQASEMVEEKLRTEKTGYGCLALLRRDLEAVYGYAVGGPCLKGERTTEGGRDAHKLWLLAAQASPPDENGKTSPFQKVAYKLRAAEGSILGLYRRSAPFVAGDDPLSGGEYSLVHQGVHTFKISYYDLKDKKWLEGEWKESDRLPSCVKIDLELAHDKEREEIARSQGVELPPMKFQMIVGLGTQSAIPNETAPPGGTTPGGGTPPGGGAPPGG